MVALVLAVSVVRVACLGDSITEGTGVANPARDAYPARLGRRLGPGFEVRNFGHSFRTMADRGDFPYARSPRYRAALAWRPDVAVVLLGTNDSKPQNAGAVPADLVPSFRSKIRALRAANPRVRIFAVLPPPTFSSRGGIRESVIAGQVIPRLVRTARALGVPTIDAHSPLLGARAIFPDTIHPNAAGAERLAALVAEGLRKAGVAPKAGPVE